MQYWAATDYPNESQYDLITRGIPLNFWNALYRDCIEDLRSAKTNITNDISIPTANKQNATAVAEVLEIYAWSTLVETFGNIPYSEAFNADNLQPKYDDQTAIYTDLITRLDAVIAKFDASTSTGLGANDLINNGSTAQWIRFANSMKLRMAMVIADADPAKAKTMAEAAASKVITSNSDAIDLTFNGTYPNTNPLWEDLVRSGRTDFVGANTFINSLKSVTPPAGVGVPMTGVVDPRLPNYFAAATSTTLPAGTYAGGVEGTTNSKILYSQPGAKLKVQTLPGVLISYGQVQLMLAEAAARGFSVGGTPESFYNAGVTASILEWGGTAAAAATYLAAPNVAYSSAPGTYKQKIGYQLWVALYNQPVASWTQWRRLDYPQLPLAANPANGVKVIPVRFTYPTSEQNLNATNYAQASAALGAGGDDVGTKLFWDKF